MSAVADVLNGAADLIERDGWCQGAYARNGRRCAESAIVTAGSPISSWEERVAARRLLHDVVGEYHVDWNDTPGRTKAEVVAALRAAAERAS